MKKPLILNLKILIWINFQAIPRKKREQKNENTNMFYSFSIITDVLIPMELIITRLEFYVKYQYLQK